MATGVSDALYLGTISGTSVDGLDIALLDFGSGVRFIASDTAQFDPWLRQTLLDLGQPGSDDLDHLGEADRALGEFIGEAVLKFLEIHGLRPDAIRALGSHGQTVRHRPDAKHPFTWQIGDPNCIAERSGITTVADFRRRDMAAGGQGAPLVPRFHQALFADPAEARAVLNIGGISNFTLLGPTGADEVGGFDCGPGNALLDSWCLQQRGAAYDDRGAWAASGQLLPGLLEQLLEDPYLGRPPPKSTGREYYNLSWLGAVLGDLSCAAEDVQRTLLEFTARSVQQAFNRWASNSARVIVCGGGRHNPVLMARLGALLDVPLETSEEHGFDGDAIEAGAFAWLAMRRLNEASGSAAAVTGAGGDRVLGGVYPG